MEDMKFHPAADLFPLLEGEEFEALKESIREYGQLEPIVTSRDKEILDGRNRYRACMELGLTPKFYPLAVGHKDTLESVYAVETNIKRRNLTASQRAQISADARGLFEEEAARRRKATQKNDAAKAVSANLREQEKSKASESVAEVFNISPRLADQAKRVKHNAIPEVVEEVKKGGLSVNAAEHISKLPAKEQANVLSMEPKLRKKAIKESRERASDPKELDDAYRGLYQSKYGPSKDFETWTIQFGECLQFMAESHFLPEYMAENFPHYTDINVRDFLDDATAYLNKFNQAWEKRNARKTN